MNEGARVYVAGHRGLVGSAIVRYLDGHAYEHLITRRRDELDLTDRSQVDAFFVETKPEYVFLSAAKVGGIAANDAYPAEFLFENLQIQTNVIDAAFRSGVKKLLFLGSSCIYPKMCPQPMKEEYLLTGPLEPTNEWYAIAKIAGIKMCQAYRKQYGFNAIALMPTNLYGPGDNFSLESSHVLPALIRKFHEARLARSEDVVVWGTGTPMREFLHVDDLAAASVYLMQHYDQPGIINVGTGVDISISDLAKLIAKVVGFEGNLVFDDSRPDGTPRKLLDTTRLSQVGWKASIGLQDGIEATYRWYLDHLDVVRT